MPSYTPPVKDLQFVLQEVLKIAETGIPGYEDLDADFTSAILDEAGKIAAEVLAPLGVFDLASRNAGAPSGLDLALGGTSDIEDAAGNAAVDRASTGLLDSGVLLDEVENELGSLD